MKAVILAGGLGTRMGEETAMRPKPLIEVGGRPVLWHILKIYQAQGISDFVICAGFAGNQIAEYFDTAQSEGWRVDVVDTGTHTATAGRLRRVRDAVGDATFCMTYGDGVANVNVRSLIAFHRDHHKLVTVTAVQPRLPFGVIKFSNNGGSVGFEEKPRLDDMWVNGGFFVIEPGALDYIDSDEQAWEEEPMTRLARAGHVTAFKHNGFWQCMDTPRDRKVLNDLWNEGKAQWKVW